MVFADVHEVHRAYQTGMADLQARDQGAYPRYAGLERGRRHARAGLRSGDHGRPRAAVRDSAGRPAVRTGRPDMTKKAISNVINACYRRVGLKATVDIRRPADVHGFLLRHPRRGVVRRRRHGHSGAEGAISSSGRGRGEGDREPVRLRSGHQRRALQQGRRHLVAHQRSGRQGDDGQARHRRRGQTPKARRSSRHPSTPFT